jgi:rubrerythrin
MNQRSLIDLFEDNELKISILYKLYSQKIPAKKTFWQKISDEEVIHAKEIARAFATEKECFKENKFTHGIVNYISGYVEEKIEEAKKNNLTHLEAINIALRIEQSMLEKKCFDLFIPTTDLVKKILEKLNKDTERHANMLRKELKKIMKPPLKR